jgi:hypothetical protein
MKKKPCRTCQQRPANRPNGLCYFCFREEQRAAGTPTAQAAPTTGSGEPVAGDAGLLAAMQHVQAHGPEHDRTLLHRDCRAWKEKKLAEFMAKRADLEKAALAPKASPPTRAGAFAGLACPAFDGHGECPTCGLYRKDEGGERARKLLREQIAQDEAAQAREDAVRAAQPGAKERGRARQEELKAALWRERQAMLTCTGLFGARRDKLTDNESIRGALFIDWHLDCRTRDLELAVRPDAENVLDSLGRAVKGTVEREREWQEGVAELEGTAVSTVTRQVRAGRHLGIDGEGP